MYDNKEILGGWPTGTGQRPRWKFDLELAKARFKSIRAGNDNVTALRQKAEDRKLAAQTQTGRRSSKTPPPAQEGTPMRYGTLQVRGE